MPRLILFTFTGIVFRIYPIINKKRDTMWHDTWGIWHQSLCDYPDLQLFIQKITSA